MLAPVRSNLPTVDHRRRTQRAPQTRERPATPAPAERSRPVPEDLDALLDGLYGEDEPEPEPGPDRGPIKIREFLSYRVPEDPRGLRGQVFNLIA